MFDSLPNLRAETTSSILISYSRSDRDAVQQLYKILDNLGFTLWRDLHDIKGGEPFWEAIKEGIDACETVVLCMSMDALNSKYVQMEWQYARQQGKRVLPVVVADVDFEKVPRWMRRIDWKDFREGKPERGTVWASFIRTLNTPYEGRKVPFMADKLPDYFVERPEEFENIVDALVDSNGAVAITAAVRGAGGFGKTTLALALCHDIRVRGAFDDGILWVTLGERSTQAELIRYALDLCALMTGERPNVQTKEAVKTELTKAIGDRYILLVIDDLWRKNDADIFLTDSLNSAVLVTTRFDHTLPDSTRYTQNVDALKSSEAIKLLTWDIESVTDNHSEALQALTERLGEWAVIVRLANATLRNRISRNDNLDTAMEWANRALTRKGLVAFDEDVEIERANAVKATLEVSLELLDDEQQVQFARLAIFPEDAEIPFTTLEKLWNMDDFDTEELTEALQDASLLASYDLDTRTIQLHDVIRQYLIDEHKDKLQAWQSDFIYNLGDLKALSDEYSWRNIAYHLQEADRLDMLRELLLDFYFLQSKINATEPTNLINDCDYFPEDSSIQFLQSAVNLSAYNLIHSPNQLQSQLIGRLGLYTEVSELLTVAQNYETHEANLLLLSPTLQPAGDALIRTLRGHTGWINDIALSDTYAVSASSDSTLRVWNWQTGEHLRTLVGHSWNINGVALSEEYAVSASVDKTLRVWNWQTGEHLRTLEGHTNILLNVALSGVYAVSASGDKTLRVWNWQTGEHLRTFEGHTDIIGSVALSGAYAVSTSFDNTLRVWNWQTGEHLRTLVGHTNKVLDVALLGEYAVSASSDHTLRVWNWQTGKHLRTLEGHTNNVNDVTLWNEYAVSASDDQTLQVWNWQTGKHLRTLEGNGFQISVALSQDYALSGSADHTLSIWNWHREYRNNLGTYDDSKNTSSRSNEITNEYLSNNVPTMSNWRSDAAIQIRKTVDIMFWFKRIPISNDYNYWIGLSDTVLNVWQTQTNEKVQILEGHTDRVESVVLSDNFAVSASRDTTLKVWNWKTGECLHTLEGHSSLVQDMVFMDQYLISASGDFTLKVWNWKTGEHLHTLEGHSSFVESVILSGDFAVSASLDTTLKVWNWKTGEYLHTLEGHSSLVQDMVFMDQYLISASGDFTLKVWNWKTGEYLHTLEGHTDSVNNIWILDNIVVSASSDCTVCLWNWKTSEHITTFYADTEIDAFLRIEDVDWFSLRSKDGRVHFLSPNAALMRILRGES